MKKINEFETNENSIGFSLQHVAFEFACGT